MRPVPILFVSDNPTLPSGLSRITKDLAIHVSSLPQFRVGVFGRGGMSSIQLPFAQYPFPDFFQWGEEQIQGVWQDFSRGEPGIIMTIWDPSRLGWFARPRMGGELQKFLLSSKISKWGYFPVDSYGVGGKLTGQMGDTLLGYNRVLAYTLFGKQVLEETMNTQDLPWIPHGYNAAVFAPRGRVAGRTMLGVGIDDRVVGCVMTNQPRKDWGIAFGAAAYMCGIAQNQAKDIKFWFHTDSVDLNWDFRALINDFGLNGKIILTMTGDYNSEQLSYLYSACDVTMLPSLGEGFGYPIIESMACGVPVAHGNYGGGAELVRAAEPEWLVQPKMERLESRWNNVRPVFNPTDWGERLTWMMDDTEGGSAKEMCLAAVDHLKWENLWPVWKKWFLEGIGE
jgi:glycosyltransferase involved in cell wall biosynthesis